jgi:glycosyltransferase involved in cell wall biosynthesis
MTRVLHVDHSAVLGGAERSVLELARAQRTRGEEVVVAVGRSGPFASALEDAGVPIKVLGWRRQYTEVSNQAPLAQFASGSAATLDAALKLRRAVRDVQPDVLQAHTRKAQLVSSLAQPGSGVPLVWHLRDDVPSRAVLRRLLRLAIGRAAHAVAISAWLADHYRAEGLLPRSGRIDVVPSGIDPAPLSGIETPWLDGQRAPVVGFVGQLARWKAPHLIIELAERLSDRPDVRFAIVGDVWFQGADHGYGRWLEERLAASPARDRIDRLGTRPPAEAFAALDVLVHTSEEPEPFGRVIVEAMMAHRPVVAFRRGGPVEILDETTGVLADGVDAEALATAVRSVIDDRSAAQERAAAAAQSAERFTPDRIAELMARAYAGIHA